VCGNHEKNSWNIHASFLQEGGGNAQLCRGQVLSEAIPAGTPYPGPFSLRLAGFADPSEELLEEETCLPPNV